MKDKIGEKSVGREVEEKTRLRDKVRTISVKGAGKSVEKRKIEDLEALYSTTERKEKCTEKQ